MEGAGSCQRDWVGKVSGIWGRGPGHPLCQERAEGPSEASTIAPGTGEGVARDPQSPQLCWSYCNSAFPPHPRALLNETVCLKKEAQASTWKALKNICWKSPRRGDPCVYTCDVCTETILAIVYSGKTHPSPRGQDSGFLWGERRGCGRGRAPGGLLGCWSCFRGGGTDYRGACTRLKIYTADECTSLCGCETSETHAL